MHEGITAERDREIAGRSKEWPGRSVQGTMATAATVNVQQCAALAVQCATAWVDTFEARSGRVRK